MIVELQNIFDLHYSNIRIKDSNNQYSNYEYLPDKRIYYLNNFYPNSSTPNRDTKMLCHDALS